MLFIFFIRNCFISTFISICRKRYLAYIYILNFLIKLLYCISLIVQCSFEIMSYFTTFFVISFQRRVTNINVKSFCTNFLHKNQKVLATAIHMIDIISNFKMAKFHSKITIDLDLNFHFVWSVVDVIIKVNIYVLQQTISMFEHYKESLSKINIGC